jgi:agmatinase
MTLPQLSPLNANDASFMGAPKSADLAALDGKYAVIGAPYGVPYAIRNVHYGASDAPAAIRARSNRYGAMLDHFDSDLLNEPFGLQPHPIRDLGDVAITPMDMPAYWAGVSETVAHILRQGAKPIVLGGDDSTTWMSIRGFADQAPVTIVQFDAHIDFRDEVDGQKEGYSSPMRRASESPWVDRIIHVGTRGPGSAKREDYEATLAAGNKVVTSRDVRRSGCAAVLDLIEPGSRVYVAFDVDGLDPSVAPGTSAPLPGGLDFIDAQDIMAGLAEHHDLVGMNIAEHYPSLDVNGITSLVITRLIATWIGTEMRGRQS